MGKVRLMRMFMAIAMIIVVVPMSHADSSQATNEMLGRYERAAHIETHEHNGVFRNLNVHPRWIEGHDSFWYERETESGHEYILIDADKAQKSLAFDHRKLAAALAKAVDKEVDAADLPLRRLSISQSPDIARFGAFGKQWQFDIRRNRLIEADTPLGNPAWRISPDGSMALFSKDNNLWVRDIESGADRQLTHDGVPFYAYAANPDATGRPAVKPEALWSPDSKRVLTIQTDDRQVLELPMISFAPADGSVRPVAWSRRTALPGDEHVTEFRVVSIDVESGRLTAAHHPRLPAVRMNDTPMGGGWAWWGGGNTLAYFVELDRGEKVARVVEFDTVTGETRIVFAERSGGYLELGSNVYTPTSLVPLPDSNELIWYSERTGWAHLYLYNLTTGELQNPITQGEWLVRDVFGVDQESRQVYISISGRDPDGNGDRNPYHREIARAGLDDGELTILSSSDDDHLVWAKGDFGLLLLDFMGGDSSQVSGISRSRRYFVETVTRIDGLPRTDLRTSDGKLVMEVEQAEAVGLPENWNWPEPVSLLAADGETEIRGVVFRPSDFSPDKSYPVIDHIYGGPQVTLAPESLTGMSFTTAQSLAELGFIVVVIDGRGTTERSRAFHESSYGAIETASNLEDHIAGVKQLAERYPYMDVERVGITGFSGGGYMTAHAMLRFPDFYKVGVSGAGNHDQRLFWHSWGERYNGLLEGDNYLQQANLTHAANLEGKILFIHGLLDHGVHAAGLFQLTQALMNENKKFDLVILPQAGHELPGYAMVRMWDYLDLMKARLMAIQAESMGGADTDAGASEEQRLE
jgi:dipeptidyl aminopeptidase/acylaminoacyl peptidase